MDGMDMPTTTGSASAAATSAAMSMDMGGGSSSCKISMLWNWYTVDTCFIASSWHVTSRGMFAGSCIGVILLVISLEFLRRAVKEYDHYLIRKHAAATAVAVSPNAPSASPKGSVSEQAPVVCQPAGFRPNVFEQAIRALLHMLQFAVAYFVMLLAMYYNGYIIICIFIGAYIGSFIFHWETLGTGATSKTSASQEATVCCG
ncbi:Ctr-domain-containing protein [Thozetella sp. PMI_491]|nr:Ctr-domain-containing protein [Thozetella sp. PMI_491]